MKIGVRLKIDVKQIEKARLFEGKEALYLDATTFVDLTQQDQFGNNGMITQDVSKDERDQGVKGNILGNVKVFWQDGSTPQQNTQASAPAASNADLEGDEIPFS